MRVVIVVASFVVFVVPCLAGGEFDTVLDRINPTFEPQMPGPVFDGGRNILYDNGPFETSAGFSTLQNVSLGMYLSGWGYYSSLMISDDFVVPSGQTWEIDRITFYGYETSAPTSPSTFTEHYLTILDGPPDQAGSSIVWGDMSVNILESSVWSGVYRDSEDDPGSTSRPIMANTCTVGTMLSAGEYWLVWNAEGSPSLLGPWAPPITIIGQVETGNAFQYTGAWVHVADGQPSQGQGFPFIIEGTPTTSPVEASTWGRVKAMFR